MVLLVMIALAMLTLSTIELRGEKHTDHQHAAQANARLALMTAIGELQKYAGSDQRITAEASILEKPTDNSAKLANRHWVGVWRSDALKGEPVMGAQPIIHRNEDNVGPDADSLLDRRSDQSYDAQDQALTWLVSHENEASTLPDPTRTLPEDESVLLVGPNSVTDADEEVRAQRIAINENGKETGGYAWWIGDEGVKARFDLTDATDGLAKSQPWQTAMQSGINIINGYDNYESLAGSDIAKVTSRHSSDLSGCSSSEAAARDARRASFHDLTFNSAGLLTDTFRGGFRRDLSIFLNKGSAPDLGDRQGLESTTPILDSERLREISAKFGLIHHWNNLGASSTSGIDPIPPKSLAGGTNWGWTGLNYPGSGIDLANQDTAPIHPILIDAGISYGVSLSKAGNSTGGITPYRINIHYYPRFVLWNPYKVTLNAAKYAVQISMPHKFDVKVIVPNSPPINLVYFETYYHDRYPNLPHRPHFSIPATSFEPGEALLFTANGNGAPNGNKAWGTFFTQNLNHYSLTCNSAPPFKDNFYIQCRDIIRIPDTKIRNTAYKVFAKADGIYKHYFYKLYLDRSSSGNVQQIKTDPSTYPPLQYITQSEDGSSGGDAPWFSDSPDTASSPLRELKDGPVTPFYRFKWGHRVQWLNETVENQSIAPGGYNTPFLDYNTVANHNMRAGWHVRSPVEVAYRTTLAGGRYTHGITIDDPYGWDWTDGTLFPVPVKGKNRVSPFGRPADYGGQTFPMLDVPTPNAPLLSIGALQHAPLSQFAWHPMYAVGNSLADPRVHRNRSSNFVSSNDWGTIGYHGQKQWSAIRQAHANSELNNTSFLHDLSYEMNHALWDRYFLSTINGNVSSDTTLDNPRLRISADTSPQTNAELQDFHKAAKHLTIKGAFNVNSTSEAAWAALIASFRSSPEMEISLQGEGILKGNDIYSRFLKPYNQEFDKQGVTEPETWKGHRKLTDEQILDLASEIVKEVKQRGPFISLADFVNRRLVDPAETNNRETDFSKTGLKGTLQAAIDRTEINSKHLSNFIIDKEEYSMSANLEKQVHYGSNYPELTFPVKNGDRRFGPKPDHNHWADSKLVGIPSYLTQADMLQKFGSVLSARSDTFVIRSYGESLDNQGNIVARAWCEAIVQRTPTPLLADDENLDPEPDITIHPEAAFGRKFQIISFRWLNNDEI